MIKWYKTGINDISTIVKVDFSLGKFTYYGGKLVRTGVALYPSELKSKTFAGFDDSELTIEITEEQAKRYISLMMLSQK